MSIFDKLPPDHRKRAIASNAITIFLAAVLTVVGILGIGVYGMALFVLTPLFIGAAPTLLYGYKRPITKRLSLVLAFQSLGIFAVLLFICAFEGVICIIMAAPIAALLTWIGSIVGRAIKNRYSNRTFTTLIILVLGIPMISFVEKTTDTPSLTSVTSSIEINASPEEVWSNVVEFPQLPEPEEFIFKTGLAYPINARIEGKGVGAIRHCNFTTGSFTEPITVWDEPRLLRFSVSDCPAPMKELSFWDIKAPHLHDYFVSKQGQFHLIKLGPGRTRLEGTTWYYHRIKPEFYWQLWSDYIIHSIHKRVLNHIKNISEK